MKCKHLCLERILQNYNTKYDINVIRFQLIEEDSSLEDEKICKFAYQILKGMAEGRRPQKVESQII